MMPLRVQSHGAVPKHHRALLGTGPGTQPRAVRGHRGKFTHGHVQGLASPSLTPERHNATKTTEAELQIQEKQERTTQTWGKKASRGRATSPSPAAPPPRASPPLPERSPGPLTCPPPQQPNPWAQGRQSPQKLPLAAGWAVSRAQGAPQAPACTTHPSQRTRPPRAQHRHPPSRDRALLLQYSYWQSTGAKLGQHTSGRKSLLRGCLVCCPGSAPQPPRAGGVAPARHNETPPAPRGTLRRRLPCYSNHPEAGNGKGNAKSSRKQQKGARLSMAEHNKSPAPAPHSCPDVTPR